MKQNKEGYIQSKIEFPEKKEGYIQCKIEPSEKAEFIELSRKEGYDSYSFLLRTLIRDYIQKTKKK